MHMANCNCPQCRAAAEGFEFATFGLGESQEILGEQEELELAMELLNVQNEQELEQFLGNVFRSVGFGHFGDQYTNSVGGGIRYSTPLGPIRLDIGHLVTPVPGVKSTQIFITLGQAF